MLLFFYKIFRTFRRAIAGRRHPHQLAWAVALGLLLGIIPHGNLVALGLLLVILCLNINHAAMGLTALATSFFAAKLDPISHQVGDFVLRQESIADFAYKAWQWPLVPWTDLNNTIVMGSLLIGLASLIPVFVLVFPLCKLIAPRSAAKDDFEDDELEAAGRVVEEPNDRFDQPEPAPAAATMAVTHPVASGLQGPHFHGPNSPTSPSGPPSQNPNHASHAARQPHVAASPEPRPIDFTEVPATSGTQPVQTRIEAVRLDTEHVSATAPHTPSGPVNDPAAMDEALNYLLRQLRDTHQGEAA